MKLLDRYIAKTLVRHITLTIVVLLGLFVFVEFITELDDLDKGRYGILQVVQYVILSIPQTLYEIFPMACLIGSILGLSLLAKDSELIVMRAAGVSISRIVFSTVKVGFALGILAFVIGEIISPITETRAQKIKALTIQNSIGLQQQSALWVRDGNTFVSIGEVLPDLTLLDLKIFEFDNLKRLRILSVAERGEHESNRWLLKDLKQTVIDLTSSTADLVSQAYWSTSLNPNLLRLFQIAPEQLPIWELDRYINHLQMNKQNTTSYELAYWSKIVAPLATIVMLVLAVPFVFKELRSGSMGKNLFSGIMIGLTFFILNRSFTFFVPIFNLPPLIGAIIPTFFVFLLAVYMIKRTV